MQLSRTFDILYYRQQQYPQIPFLGSKQAGKWQACSIDQAIDTINKLSYALLKMGLSKGDTVAMISNNRPEWNYMDMAMAQLGVVNTPIYTTLSESEFTYILNDSGAKLCFVSDESLFRKITAIKDQCSNLTAIYTFDHLPQAVHYSTLIELGAASANPSALAASKAAVLESDLCTLIYTSGTTGNPKGVMLSHRNLVSNVWAVRNLTHQPPASVALSFLPLCHSYERILTYLYAYLGFTVYYAESLDKISDNIKELQPNIFSCVPRLLEKVFDKIMEKGKALTGVKRGLFFWAVDLGLRYDKRSSMGWLYDVQLTLANKLIFSKWREALGGNVKAIVSGGAALQPRLARIFWAANIPVLEGYGLTETSPVIAVNNFEPDSICFGTVGPVIEGVTVKFADDGEILCKGPNVMMGYYKQPQLTSEVIDREGWFHTGDIGTLVDQRFLKITDRKKEIFKTSGGKYIAPQALENKFKESNFIEQIMVVGENQKYAAALIVPAMPFVTAWAKEKGIKATTAAELVKTAEVKERIWQEVERLNKNFGQTEQVKKIALLEKEWTIDGGQLTPTLKLKRKFIGKEFKSEIDNLYN
ncbi:MAG: hypothetical protein RIQ89_314 [Bacteroidota bacterium]|jgi:long-chain acyl-CoA synthetase